MIAQVSCLLLIAFAVAEATWPSTWYTSNSIVYDSQGSEYIQVSN